MKDRERLWPNCVFYLFKSFSLCKSVIYAVDSCHWLFSFWFGWHAFGWGLLVQKAFFSDYQAGFLWLEFMCCFCCWVLALYTFYFGVCFVCVSVCLLKWLLELLSITPFSHPDVSFPPLLSIMLLPPVSAMHLGNQEMESDAEDEVKPHPPHHLLPSALDL